jgi:hypothetical protein
VREALLVVESRRRRRLVDHAAAVLPRRRAQDPRDLFLADRVRREDRARDRAVPFFDFWGPKSGLRPRDGSRTRRSDARGASPSLTLVYLPHLDYDFQRHGPADARSLRAVEEIDAVFADLRSAAERAGAEIVVVSEYGIDAVETPIDVNRALRKSGLLSARATPAGEVLDTFGSRAFAVADHQVAHVYTKSREALEHARSVVLALPGVERVIDGEEKREAGLDHPRAGDLVAIARPGTWFTYYYWLDDRGGAGLRAHGRHPSEAGLRPVRAVRRSGDAVPPRGSRGGSQKKLGMRYLMDVIPTDARRSAGATDASRTIQDGPVFLCSRPFGACGPPASGVVEMESVKSRVLEPPGSGLDERPREAPARRRRARLGQLLHGRLERDDRALLPLFLTSVSRRRRAVARSSSRALPTRSRAC